MVKNRPSASGLIYVMRNIKKLPLEQYQLSKDDISRFISLPKEYEELITSYSLYSFGAISIITYILYLILSSENIVSKITLGLVVIPIITGIPILLLCSLTISIFHKIQDKYFLKKYDRYDMYIQYTSDNAKYWKIQYDQLMAIAAKQIDFW